MSLFILQDIDQATTRQTQYQPSIALKTSNMLFHSDKYAGAVKAPSGLAHVVLRTTTDNFEKMVSFYEKFLGGTIRYRSDLVAFVTYDYEHHRIAIVKVPRLEKNPGNIVGLEHIAFTFDSLQDLCAAYKQRLALGITPGWCANHGPTTSIYYLDPDGNKLETQVDNFEGPDEATEFMRDQRFTDNPLGEDLDVEEFCAKVEAGGKEEELKKRNEVGKRGAEALPGIWKQMARSRYEVDVA